MAHSPRFLELVSAARAQIIETDVKTVKKSLDKGLKFVLVDVREDSEYAKEHIPGAVHLGKGVIERDIEQRFPDEETELVLYCGGGYRSALAALNVRQMGYYRVTSMDGGFTGWKEAGFDVES